MARVVKEISDMEIDEISLVDRPANQHAKVVITKNFSEEEAMPKYNNRFKSPDHIEETIVDKKGAVVGTIRVKPTSILWKAKSQQTFSAVSLQAFVEWIEGSDSGSKKVSK